MEKVQFVKITNPLNDEITEHAIIDHGNDEFTSMLKSVYDEQQKALKESLVFDEPATKSK